MTAEPGSGSSSRFAHLLQPIRDLSKIWKIEIAEELERYIEEVSELVVTNPGDGFGSLNFAEAALLIQGSTAIYSRKVELLYQLVYQALELLAVDKTGKDGAGRKGKAVQSGLWAQIPDTDELLTIDHLIKEGRNILLDQSAPEQRRPVQRRVPLFLMPREQSDRRKHEFRISSCTVHPTGAYLLQESDARLLDEFLAEDGAPGAEAEGPLVPPPPLEVQELDSRLQELLRGLPPPAPGPGWGEDAAGLDMPPLPGSPAPRDAGAAWGAKETPAKHRSPVPAHAAGAQAVVQAPDPWALLNEHEVVGQDTPLDPGRSSKRVNAKRLLVNAEQLPVVRNAGLSDTELWRAYAAADLPMLSIVGNPVESLFLALAGQLKPAARYETWQQFEDLVRGKGVAAGAGGDNEDAASDADVPLPDIPDGVAPLPAAPLPGGLLAAQDGADGPVPIDGDDRLRHEEHLREVAELETLIQDAQGKYESTIRQHLQALQKDSAEGSDPRFPELYANVRRWQDQLEPVLKEFESRPQFDIHSYSTRFISKMASLRRDGEESADHTIPFARLVHGQPRWEVCRRFLTCLFLTNQGNTDIVYETEEDRRNNFGVKLLKAEKRMISLDGEEPSGDPADAAAPPPGRGGRKKEAPGADAAAAAARKRRRSAGGA